MLTYVTDFGESRGLKSEALQVVRLPETNNILYYLGYHR
jgi:hypothetical protein